MEDAVNEPTAGSSGPDRDRRCGLRRVACRLAPDGQAAQQPRGGANPGRPARLPPGDSPSYLESPAAPAPPTRCASRSGHAGQAGPLRPDRDQWHRRDRPAAAHRGWADRLDVAGAGARQPAQRLRHPRPGPTRAVAVLGQRRRAGVGGGQQSAHGRRGRHRPRAAAPPGDRGGRRRRRHRGRAGRRAGRDAARGGQPATAWRPTGPPCCLSRRAPPSWPAPHRS